MTDESTPFCVLVVDDDEPVRRVTMRALEVFGFTTLGAKDGNEAVGVVREHGRAIHCAIVDMNMPGLDGEQTMRGMHAIEAGLPVLLASGFAADELPGACPDAAFAGYLQKPYQIATLARTVREAIDTVGSRELALGPASACAR